MRAPAASWTPSARGVRGVSFPVPVSRENTADSDVFEDERPPVTVMPGDDPVRTTSRETACDRDQGTTPASMAGMPDEVAAALCLADWACPDAGCLAAVAPADRLLPTGSPAATTVARTDRT